MKKVLCAMMLFAAAILCLHQNVSAAEGATVTVNGDTLQAGSDAWKVTLDISGDTKITNGKIRVTYDSSQLKLVSTEAGSMMNGVLTDINDPVSGNKSEGEAVFVFASSTELDTNGTLFEMTFQVQDSVKDGDSVTVSAKTEELQNNNAAVAVTDVPLNAAVGRQSNNNGNNNGGNDSSTEPQTETASNNGNNGNGSGSDNQGGSGSFGKNIVNALAVTGRLRYPDRGTFRKQQYLRWQQHLRRNIFRKQQYCGNPERKQHGYIRKNRR